MIVSPDSKNDKSNVKDEVENIREAINGDDELPVATLQQLNDTLGVRQKLKEAIERRTYAKGSAVADDIDVQLRAKKDDDKFESLNIAAVEQEEEALIEKQKPVDTSTKKELPNRRLYEINPGLAELVNPTNGRLPPYPWIGLRWHEEKPLVLKGPTIYSVLKLPIFKLRHDFARKKD